MRWSSEGDDGLREDFFRMGENVIYLKASTKAHTIVLWWYIKTRPGEPIVKSQKVLIVL